MTTFKGHITGFKPGKSNDCDPNPLGPPTTKFGGRPGVPAGPFKYFPGPTADIDDGNRRLAKVRHGADDGCATNFNGRTAFNRGGKK